MSKYYLSLVVLFSFNVVVHAQSISQRLQGAFAEFESDSMLKHSVSSLYVIDAKTGEVVFDRNSMIGLAPASTQKIITSATAFELLGEKYRYRTGFGTCTDENKKLWLYIQPSGDPSFGSWRWEKTREESVLAAMQAIPAIPWEKCTGIAVDTSGWGAQSIPDGWIWQDIGNYYGAGAGILNWRENQYDLYLKSGEKPGDPVKVSGTRPELYHYPLASAASSGAAGSGDNAYIYFPVEEGRAIVRGTIPAGENNFRISGAIASPVVQFTETLAAALRRRFGWTPVAAMIKTDSAALYHRRLLYTYYSPALDSLVYWFLKKSINLYGEALIRTMAGAVTGSASMGRGTEVISDFWKERGIEAGELNLYDGSGLSPLNRVTTHAQVMVLKYARSRTWFQSFYEALPEYNGMKMKSGTINDVKGFCGYQAARDGREYIFSFLVNNYRGRSSVVTAKMYKVLDLLK